MAEKGATQTVSISAWSLLLIALIVWWFGADLDESNRRLADIQRDTAALRLSVERLEKSLAAGSAKPVEPGERPAAPPSSGSGSPVAPLELQVEKPDAELESSPADGR